MEHQIGNKTLGLRRSVGVDQKIGQLARVHTHRKIDRWRDKRERERANNRTNVN